MQVERGALSSVEFKEFGKKVVLFCHITSHVPGDPYPELLREKGGRGFPTFYFLDPTGKVVGEPSGRSVAAWETALKEVLPQMPPPKAKKGPKVWDFKDAWKEGAEKAQVILLLVRGDKEKTMELTEALFDKKLEKTLAKFLLVEIAFDKEDELCRKLELKEGPALVAIDPTREKVEEGILGAFLDGPTIAKLSAFLKKWEKPKK